MTGSDRWTHLGRRGALLAAGAGVGAGLVLVGAPRLPGPAVTGGSSRPAALLDRAMLTTWCHRLLDDGARAERIGGEWWCAGRPGGVWRIEPIVEGDACDANGFTGENWAPTDEGLNCRKGA